MFSKFILSPKQPLPGFDKQVADRLVSFLSVRSRRPGSLKYEYKYADQALMHLLHTIENNTGAKLDDKLCAIAPYRFLLAEKDQAMIKLEGRSTLALTTAMSVSSANVHVLFSLARGLVNRLKIIQFLEMFGDCSPPDRGPISQ